MNTRQAALDAVHGLYCRRVCGMAPADQHTTYTGTMDLQAFVDACPIPSDSDLQTHRICWTEMRTLFDQAWARHGAEQGIGRVA